MEFQPRGYKTGTKFSTSDTQGLPLASLQALSSG